MQIYYSYYLVINDKYLIIETRCSNNADAITTYRLATSLKARAKYRQASIQTRKHRISNNAVARAKINRIIHLYCANREISSKMSATRREPVLTSKL